MKRYLRHKISIFYNRCFNPTVWGQLRDTKEIPIIIISFNQLATLKLLVDFLWGKSYRNIIIVDNNSTYGPLLEYLLEMEKKVQVHRLKQNHGHLAFWTQEQLVRKYTKGYYVVTDPDVVPIEHCPDDFMIRFRKLLDMAYDRTKVGFSLKIDDIPNTNPNKKIILNWEAQFWKTQIKPGVYKAEIDTTFALYRPKYTYKKKNFTKAWRSDYPYQAYHLGWYFDINNLTEEQRFYKDTANKSASWLSDDKGTLKFTKYKKIYKDNE